MAISPLDYILQGARKILEKGEDAFRDDSNLGIAKNTFAPSSLLSATNKLFFEQSTAPQQYLKKVTGLKSPAETQRELLATIRANQLPTQRLDQFGLPASTIGKQTTKVTDILKTATPKEKELLALSQARNLAAGFAGYAPQKKALTSIAPQVAKSTDIGEIANLLKKEIPSLADDTANNFARVFKDLTDPKAIDTAINKIKFQAQGKTTGMADDLITNVKAIMETGKPLPVAPSTPALPSKMLPVASKVGTGANPLLQKAKKETIEQIASRMKAEGKTLDEFVNKETNYFYGGGSEIKKIDGRKISKGGELGDGFYFTGNEDKAKLYGGTITNLKVELENPLIITKDELWKKGGLMDKYNQNPKYNQELAKQGYDGVLVKEGNKIDQGIVFNPSQIKTKSQLTEIWNKANKNNADDALINEAKKYKSAEEFVKAQGTPVYHGTSLENANKINTEGFKAGAGKGVSGQASGDFVYATGNKVSANKYVSDRLGIKNPTIIGGSFNGKTLEIQGKMADFEAFGEASKKLGVPLKIGSQGKPTMLNMPAIKKAMQEQGYGAISFSDRYANGSKAFAILPENIKTKSQLTDIWNKANKAPIAKMEPPKIRQMKTSAEIPSLERTAEMQGVTPVVKPKAPQKQTVKLTPPSQVASPKVTATKPLSTGEERTLEKLAQQQALKANQVSGVEVSSLPKIIQQQTPVSKKIGLLDYIRTPENVLKKIGLEKESKLIRDSYEAYVKELPTNIQKITDWSKRVSKESNRRIFRYLDNQAVDLNPKELKVAGEIKGWLAEWADRLGLPKDNRIAEYITHIFDDQLIKKEFDEDLAKIIADKIPGSVYNPFLEKRLGAKGYIEDTWRALDAYVKRATRKVHMDKALERLEEVSSGLEESQWKYIKRYADRINMRPTEADNLIDNQLKQIIGYKLGQRPVANISRVLRQTTFRGMLGANLGSALRNLTQGVNTYAKLGEKYTAIGYKDLLTKGIKELKDNGILADNLVQDRALSSTKKAIEKLDKGLFFFFDTAEKINRGSAYYGAKAKALAMGKSETGAIEYAKKIVRDTQFQYGAIDTPVAMNSDIVKVLTQFMTYPVKQTEFLAGMAKNKEYMGIARYVLGGLAVVYTVGQVLGMKPTEMIPFFDYASGQRKFGVPPSLKFPIEVIKAGLGAKDQYGQERTIGKKISDVAKTGMGVIPGGIQIKKTYEGAKSVLEGGSYDKSGRKQFEQGESKASQLQSILFGKYAGKNAREYYDEGALSTRAKAKVKPIYDQIQQLKAQGKMDEALTIAQSLSEAEAEVYKSIKSAEKAKQTQELKKKVTPIYNKIQKLKANGQIDEALVIAQSLSEDEIRVYKLIKEADTKRRQLEEVISQ
jgi:enhancing lycopene biosynthesis protein 2